MSGKKPPKGAFKRSLKLLGAAAQIVGKEAGKQVRDVVREKWDEKAPEYVKLRVEQAKILTDNLSELKGAAMKMGQLLSLDLADLLPPEAIEILGTLQNKAKVIDFSIMRELLVKELGEEKLKLLTGIGEREVYAASIGQVYKASLQGQDVAVKVQYPSVAESVDSDVMALEKLITPLLRVSGRQMNLKGTFEEIQVMLQLETDYNNEREALKKYKNFLSSEGDYIVPEPYDDFSTERILTMSWHEGLTIPEWMKTNPSQEDREAIAHQILKLYNLEFYQWGFVQTDPNAGNFLVQQNPLKLILLDLGSSKHFERPFIESYSNMIRVFSEGDYEKTIQAAYDFDLIDRRESKETLLKYYEMMKVALEPFFGDQQPFQFKDLDYGRRSRQSILEFTSSLKYSPPPRHIIFLHRKLGGVFNLVKTLDVPIDLRPYWEEVLGKSTKCEL